MEKLKLYFPVFFSPKFWGVVLTALAFWLNKHGFTFSPEALSEFVLAIAGAATSIGVIDSVARKIGN